MSKNVVILSYRRVRFLHEIFSDIFLGSEASDFLHSVGKYCNAVRVNSLWNFLVKSLVFCSNIYTFFSEFNLLFHVLHKYFANVLFLISLSILASFVSEMHFCVCNFGIF